MDSSQAFGLAHLWAQSDTIIRSHGGWLEFVSTPLQGTIATVLLPRYGPDEITGRMI